MHACTLRTFRFMKRSINEVTISSQVLIYKTSEHMPVTSLHFLMFVCVQLYPYTLINIPYLSASAEQ